MSVDQERYSIDVCEHSEETFCKDCGEFDNEDDILIEKSSGEFGARCKHCMNSRSRRRNYRMH